MRTEEKDRLTMRVQPEFKEEIMNAANAEGLSANEFLKMAVRFYLDRRALGNNTILPQSIVKAIDGRLGVFEDRIASLLYKLSVEMDMISALNAHAYEIDTDTLRRLRADSVRNVKQTNGRISFEDHVREAGDSGAWQD